MLTTFDIRRCDSVILDFIGGEPFLEPELIEDICDYFKIRIYELGISWYWNYRISICANSVNYHDERVQKLIRKNKGKISVGITVDGIVDVAANVVYENVWKDGDETIFENQLSIERKRTTNRILYVQV